MTNATAHYGKLLRLYIQSFLETQLEYFITLYLHFLGLSRPQHQVNGIVSAVIKTIFTPKIRKHFVLPGFDDNFLIAEYDMERIVCNGLSIRLEQFKASLIR